LREELTIVAGTAPSDCVLPQVMRKMERLGIRESTLGLVIPVIGLVLVLSVDRFVRIARALGSLIGNCVATVVIAARGRYRLRPGAPGPERRGHDGHGGEPRDVDPAAAFRVTDPARRGYSA